MSLTPDDLFLDDDLFKIAVGVKLELISSGHKVKIYKDVCDGYTKWGISSVNPDAKFNPGYTIIFYPDHMAVRGGRNGNDYEVMTYDYDDPQALEKMFSLVLSPDRLFSLTMQIALSHV